MEIIFKEEKGNLFGSTKTLGIGKRQPKLIYGEQAKKLREEANITIDALAKEFETRSNVITKIENQSIALDEKMCKKYMDKFNVSKDYFFDLDLETLILTGEGHIIKSFDSSKECREAFNDLMEYYANAVENKDKNIIVDFTVSE